MSPTVLTSYFCPALNFLLGHDLSPGSCPFYLDHFTENWWMTFIFEPIADTDGHTLIL